MMAIPASNNAACVAVGKPQFYLRTPRTFNSSRSLQYNSVATMAAMHLMNSRVVALVRGVPKSFAKV